jgi:DUF4097 and DUF4098 domain-containing protein YvlB
LKLLEDGKINADEAARLLEALSHSEGKERKGRHKIWSSFEAIPEVIATAINSSFKDVASRETLHFPRKEKIVFKGISGDVDIVGGASDTITIEKDGFAKITERHDTLLIKAISGDLKIEMPTQTDFTIKGVSGDMKISHLNSTVEITSVSGNIVGKELSGSLAGDFISGDVDLEFQKLHKIKIKSKSGNITLRLDEHVEAAIALETEKGYITCDFELQNEKKKMNKLTGVINKAVGAIEISSEQGNISIKKRNQ